MDGSESRPSVDAAPVRHGSAFSAARPTASVSSAGSWNSSDATPDDFSSPASNRRIRPYSPSYPASRITCPPRMRRIASATSGDPARRMSSSGACSRMNNSEPTRLVSVFVRLLDFAALFAHAADFGDDFGQRDQAAKRTGPSRWLAAGTIGQRVRRGSSRRSSAACRTPGSVRRAAGFPPASDARCTCGGRPGGTCLPPERTRPSRRSPRPSAALDGSRSSPDPSRTHRLRGRFWAASGRRNWRPA